MSKTEKTDPSAVKMARHHRAVEEHDHREGECDLPDHVTFDSDTRCQWGFPTYDGRNVYCGCDMCTGRHVRKEDRRRSRHESKAFLHDVARDPEMAFDATGEISPKNEF